MTNNLFFKDRQGRYRTNSSVSKQDIIDFASSLLIPDFVGNTIINAPEKCWNFLKFLITDNSKEHFAVIYLTSKSQVISFEIIASGSIDHVSVAPRRIVQEVIKHSASRVILAHNHPSGAPRSVLIKCYVCNSITRVN